jgi:hypothetical protein
MDDDALLVQVGELGVAEDERMILLPRMPNPVKARDSINQLVYLSQVDLDDRKT